MRRLMMVAMVVAYCASAVAADMLVFKRDSRYRGAALRITSLVEGKDGRLVITAANGDLYSAAAADVDWPTSREMSESLHKKEAEQALVDSERDARDSAARLADQADREPLTVLEASRRFGVDKPGMSVSDGTAAHDVGRAAAPPSASAAKEAAAAAAAAGKLKESDPQTQRAKSKLDAAKANRDGIAKLLEGLRADKNPDPLSAANRGAQIERREKELQAAEQKVAEAEKALAEATQKGAPGQAGASGN